MTYSHIDRIVVGGINPLRAPVVLPAELGKAYGVEFFLQRRELGLINIGGPGWAKIDGVTTEVGAEDALYVGQGARELSFGSFDPAQPGEVLLQLGAGASRLSDAQGDAGAGAAQHAGRSAHRRTGAPSTSSSIPRCCRPASSPWA